MQSRSTSDGSGRNRSTSIDLEALEPRILLNGAPGDAAPKLVLESHVLKADELESLKERIGVSEEGGYYNTVIDGHGTGWRPPTAEEWDQMVGKLQIVDSVSLPSAPGQPPSVDWTTSQYFPAIGNQGSEGSCTAWAVVYYTKTFQEASEHGWDLSTVNWVGDAPDSQLDHIFSPDFVYHQINDGYDGGSWDFDAIEIIKTIGAATWSTMPYSDSDHSSWPAEAAWREAPLYRGDGSASYLDVSVSLDGLKDLLAAGNLAQINIDAGDMVEMSTLDNFQNLSINHCVTVVGYDDNMSYTEGGSTQYGAFKIANSWGNTWSGETDNDGCFWLSYEAMRQRVGNVTFYDDLIGYEPELVAAFTIDHNDRGEAVIELGAGDTGAPTVTKSFISPQMASDGNDPFPSNIMVLDITEFLGSVSIPQNFFIEVYDTGSSMTGEIDYFAVEQYSDYAGGVPDTVRVSADPVVNTVQGSSVYAQLVFGTVAGVDLLPVDVSLGTDALFGYSYGELSYSILNAGDTAAGAFDVNIYISDDNAVGGGDDYLLATEHVAGLNAYATYSGTVQNPAVPVADPFATDGQYYLILDVDFDNDVAEADEGNNVLAEEVTWDAGAIFYDDFSSDQGWGGLMNNRWEIGPATAGVVLGLGYPDPALDTSPGGDNQVLGYNIGGNYENNIVATRWTTSPFIDCSNASDVTLEFERWLNVEDSFWDHAYVQVFNGVSWITIYENAFDVTDSSWQHQEFDVSASADGNANFRVRFGMGPTDSSVIGSGWNIDDLQVTGTIEPDMDPPEVAYLSIGGAMQTPVGEIEVVFSENMAQFAMADEANYSLIDDTTMLPVDFDLVPDSDSVLIDITGTDLYEGEYTLTLSGDGLTDTWGNRLDGDENGTEGGDFVFSFVFKLPGIQDGQISAYGGLITFYDTTDGITPDEVDVRAVADVSGNSNGIRKVVLKPQYSEFGVVIQQRPGSDQAIKIVDDTYPGMPISYIVLDGNASKVDLNSPLSGYDINGLTVGDGVVLPMDVDHDGETDDPVGLAVSGYVEKFQTEAPVVGDVASDHGFGKVKFKGDYGQLMGDFGTGGPILKLKSSTPLMGSVWSEIGIGKAKLEAMANGSYLGGRYLGKLKVSEDCRGMVEILGNAEKIKIGDDAIGALFDIDGYLESLKVGDAFDTSEVFAYACGKIKINGAATSTDPVSMIHADVGGFDLKVDGESYYVDFWNDMWFDGGNVHACVGVV